MPSSTMKPKQPKAKPATVTFKLEPHSVKDEFWLTITGSAAKDPDIYWLTRAELRRLKELLKDV